MRTIGVIATVVVAVAVVGFIVLVTISLPDIKRYFAIRRM